MGESYMLLYIKLYLLKYEGVGLEVVNQADLGGNKPIDDELSFSKKKITRGQRANFGVSYTCDGIPSWRRVGSLEESAFVKIRVRKRSIPTGAQAHTI